MMGMNSLAAGITGTIIVLVLLFVILQRYYVAGIATSGLKG